MDTFLKSITGNQLRILKYLYEHPKGNEFATIGHIKDKFYIRNKVVENEHKAEDDLNYLISKKLIDNEDRNLWLTNAAISIVAKYFKNEADLILNDLIDVDYDFALLNYLHRRNEFVNRFEFPNILLDFAPAINSENYPQKKLDDSLFKLKMYLKEKNQWYKLNDYGNQYISYQNSKRRKKEEKAILEEIILNDTVSSTKFNRKIAILSAFTAILAILVSAILELKDDDPIKIKDGNPIKIHIPELNQILQTHDSILIKLQELNMTYQKGDTLSRKVIYP